MVASSIRRNNLKYPLDKKINILNTHIHSNIGIGYGQNNGNEAFDTG